MTAQEIPANTGIEVLIVEDSAIQAELLRRALVRQGYGVAVARNGVEGLARIKEQKPTLVISDIVMPEMDGFRLCKEIKSDEALKDTPVILLTALSSPQDVLKGLECGADSFVRKPYDEKYLLSRINYTLTNQELRRSERTQLGVEIYFAGQKHLITSERQQILDLLISTYEEAVHVNEELETKNNELKHASQFLNGLYYIAKGLNQATNEQEVAQTALARALELPGVRAGWISLREGEAGFRLAATRNLPPGLEAAGTLAGDCQCQRQLLSGELNQAMNILDCEGMHKTQGDTRSLCHHASVPLWSGGRTVGVMNLAGPEQGRFHDEDLKLLNGIGNQVGTALERARLHEHLEREVKKRTVALTAEIAERKRAEKARQKAHDELEIRVQERTAELVKANEALQAETAERKEAEHIKDELVSVVSHELRTPLTSLRGFAELMLRRDFTPEKRHEFLTIIHNESVRLTNLINDFLDIQRMESSRQIYNFERVDIGELLRESAASFIWGDGQHTLRFEVPNTPLLVEVDADRIRQVFANLLSNAIKFSPQGGEITLGARPQGKEAVVWVADRGVGIPPEALPQLFGKFFRVDNKETRDIGGTGLGLALVKEIVEAHQGRVWVESQSGQGSTFFFTLPVAGQAISVPQAVTGGATDILLVEDDQAYVRLLREHFAGTGLSVTATDQAEQALQSVGLSPPRLVLLDIHLAGPMDGWDFLVALKSDPALQFIPVLIISASEEINARGLAVGGADYLLKPISRKRLMQATRRHLPSLSGKRVLVAEGNAVFRRQVAELLAAEGSQVDEAATGQEALACIAQGMPDLLLLDLLMPEMDGFEVLRQLRADKRALNLPVLIMTGNDLSLSEKAYIKHSMASLLSKREASLDYFTQAVGQMLGISQVK